MKRPLLGLILLLVTIGGAVYWIWLREEPLPEGLIQASGRIEGDEITIAADLSGRIVEMAVGEGAQVEAGEVLVRLDDRAVRARVAQAENALAAAGAGVQQARAGHQSMQAGLEAAEKSLAILRDEVPLQIEAASAELEAARAAHATAEANEEKVRADYDRRLSLYEREVITEEEFEAYELAWTEAQNTLRAARADLQSAEQRMKEARLGEERIEAQEAEVQRLRADAARAAATVDELQARRGESEAALDEAHSILEDLTIAAPSPGTIVTRIAEPGEVIVAGGPLYDLVDLDRLYLKVYIPQRDVGKLFLGAPARVHTDAFPDESYQATVGHIASRAEFTPREVQTPEQRVKMVFAVKLFLEENPGHRLTPGLPADAVIRWKEGVPWRKPQW